MLGEMNDTANNDRLRALLHSFVKEVQSSPLYTALCPLLAETPSAVALLAAARPQQRRPNLLLAAMHASLLRDRAHQLAEWYPTVGGFTAPIDSALGSVVAAFVSERTEELRALIAAGATQTNEPGRTAVLLPALAVIADRFESPVAMLDVGTSAGLNLRLDHYQYTYKIGESEVRLGDPSSPVSVLCDASRSTAEIPFDAMRRLEIATREGVDLNPLDVHDEEQTRWLQALVWPDEPARCERLGAALQLARAVPANIRQGDAVEAIADMVKAVPKHVHPVVVTTWVMTYLSPRHRAEFAEVLAGIGRNRPITWLFMEHPLYASELPFPTDARAERADNGTPVVAIDYDQNETARWVATTHGHGTWLAWR